jgi:TolA-binding protein
MRKFLIATTILAGFSAAPALAQSNLEPRVGKLEGEMRAVQRKVFPGGGAYLEPQITPEQAPTVVPGTPSTSAVADLTQRVSSLESQIASLTGQIEQTQYKQRQLEDAFNAYKRATDARLSAGAEATPAAGMGGGEADDGAPPPTRPTTSRPAGPVSVPRDAARAAQVSAVEKPQTGDAAEDAYLYGYRLWMAKLYPEAEAQLKSVATDFPKSKRASYAQNLLGRAYLDEGKPSLASIAFYDNYKKMPDGERAPESLFYLADALMKLKKPADACKVYGELSDVYAGKISPSMQAGIAKGRAAASCK